MENMKIDRVAKRDAKDVMRFLKKHNPIFYNGINKDIRTWFLTYKYNAEIGEPRITGIHNAVFIEDWYQREPCVCSYCGMPERDPKHRINANYCSYCGAKIVERQKNYEKIK